MLIILWSHFNVHINLKYMYSVCVFVQLGGCPLRGKSSMCMMCLKYRIILLIVIKNLWVILSHISCSGAPPRTSLGRLQRPSDPSTFPHTALHLPFRHLAINLFCRRAVATSMRKLQRKHRKMWRNARHYS